MYPIRNRPSKRWQQNLFTKHLVLSPFLAKFRKGNAIVLSGPEPTKALKYYKDHKIARNYILVEEDYDTYLQALENIDYSEDIINDDIFKVIARNTKTTSGIDFDFCTTLTEELAENIVQSIKKLKRPYIWFRLTTCHRKIKGGVLRNRQYELIEKINNYKQINTFSVNYRDTSSPPMNCWQVVMRRTR